jgi:hypothetical protein
MAVATEVAAGMSACSERTESSVVAANYEAPTMK